MSFYIFDISIVLRCPIRKDSNSPLVTSDVETIAFKRSSLANPITWWVFLHCKLMDPPYHPCWATFHHSCARIFRMIGQEYVSLCVKFVFCSFHAIFLGLRDQIPGRNLLYINQNKEVVIRIFLRPTLSNIVKMSC